MQFRSLQGAASLPPEWDILAENYFQKTSFLSHTEKYNPCQQRYYLCTQNGKLVSGAIVYSLRLDILTFLKVKSPLLMHIVGIPCSVSSPGIFGNKATIEALREHIYETQKGFTLVLNLKEKPLTGTYASGRTLPTIVMSNDFNDWEDYVASLRSDYRRRLKQINKPNDDLKFKKIPCSEFTEEMYLQYLEVYKKSSGKLEKLSFDFFKHLPSDFMMTVCLKNNRSIGWNISILKNNTYYFFMGGIDYRLNEKYKTYLRLLSSLLKDGIEKKTGLIELGQTAEVPKMRMGGNPIPRFMEAHHSNLIFNKLIKLSSPLLEYKRKLENSRPVKKESI
jgi:hypothetical protein